MKKIAFITLLLSVFTCMQAREYTFGTYNIRIIKSDDVDYLIWNNRKGAVIHTVVDNHTDVCSFQEIEGPEQEQDLRDSLASYGYDIYVWGRSSAITKLGERLAVAWRDSIFEKLDQGFFFHTADPVRPGIGWDASHARISVWVKLRDRSTDDILYYFSTHLDVNGARARRETAWINNYYVRTIAGKYPVVLGGDFNVDANDLSVLGAAQAYMNDSYKVSQTPPQGPYRTHPRFVRPQDISMTGGARMDILLSRHCQVLSYKTHTEDYGRGIIPSDHLFTSITAIIDSPAYCDSLPTAWYVDPQANEEGNGTMASPFRYLEDAIAMAQSGDTIRCRAGEMISKTDTNPSFTIERSVILEGGYNADFTSQDSLTLLDGNQTHTLIQVGSAALLYLSYFGFVNGYSSGNGGAILLQGCGLVLRHCSFSHCTAANAGGAVYSPTKLIIESCTFDSCSAPMGGAIYMQSPSQSLTISRSVFHANQAQQYGGAVATQDCCGGYLYANLCANNSAGQGGALYLCNNQSAQQLLLTNNFLTRNQAPVAVYLQSCNPVGLVANTMINNADTAVYVHQASSLYLCNNIVAANALCDVAHNSASVTIGVRKNNIYSAADRISITMGTTDYVAENYDSAVTYIARTYDSTLVATPYFGSKAINTLKSTALKEPSLTVDVSGDYQYKGTMQDTLHTDMYGNLRPLTGSATYGAVEYIQPGPTNLQPQFTLSPSHPLTKILKGDQVLILRDDRIYNLLGQPIN